VTVPISSAGAITPARLLDLIDRGDAPCIVDVRTRAEFAAGHVPGAVNVPAGEAWSSASALPGGAVVVYCGHGPRAWFAAIGLRRRGIRTIVYLRGHWAAWRRAGLRAEID
jgi:rhodanese-related sulfurtransferase